MLKWLVILVSIVTAGATTYGPHLILGVDEIHDVTQSNNSTAIQIVTDVLSDYYFVGVAPEDNVFDCSDISELIWYALNNNGIDAILVGNYAIHNGKMYAHMFVWVPTQDGVVIIESRGENWSESRLGEVIYDPTPMYTSGWVWDSPTEFLKAGQQDDMRGITLDTPIEELPIRRKS